MKKPFNNIRYEMRLNFYNKSIFVALGLMILFLLITYGNLINNFEGNRRIYQTTYELLLEEGEDLDALMQQEVHITEEIDSYGGVTQYIDNTLRYDYEKMLESYSDIQGRNCIVPMLKNSTLIYLALLFSLYMVYVATYEFSANTIKSHFLLESPFGIAYSKLQAGLISATGIYFVATAAGWGIASIWSWIYLNDIRGDFPVTSYGWETILKSIFVSYVVILLFCVLGYVLGLLVRHMAIGVGLSIVLHLMIPSLGKYSNKNLIISIYQSAYQLDLGTSISYYEGVAAIPAFVLICVYAGGLFLIASLCFYRTWKRGHNW